MREFELILDMWMYTCFYFFSDAVRIATIIHYILISLLGCGQTVKQSLTW